MRRRARTASPAARRDRSRACRPPPSKVVVSRRKVPPVASVGRPRRASTPVAGPLSSAPVSGPPEDDDRARQAHDLRAELARGRELDRALARDLGRPEPDRVAPRLPDLEAL